MKPADFLRTLYLGDRACKSVLLDGWNRRVVVEVDDISRIRSASGHWEYYTDEDIENGLIVFTGVESVRFDPPGPLPNDYISGIEVKEMIAPLTAGPTTSTFLFELSISSGDSTGNWTEVLIEIIAGAVHLEDPARPGVEITE